MRYHFRKIDLSGPILIETESSFDNRGFFKELYKRSEFLNYGIPDVFVQDCYSHSVRNVLRGFHYQKAPKAQRMLVRVIRGTVFDVIIDIRKGSVTYGQWFGVTFSDERAQMLYIPVGFAHGFCVLSEEADVLYKMTEEYAPELDRGIIWNDPEINVRWPIKDPVLSARDASLPFLREADNDFI